MAKRIADRIADKLVERQVAILRRAEGRAKEIERTLRELRLEVERRLRSTDLTRWSRARTVRLLAEIKTLSSEFARAELKGERLDLVSTAQTAVSRTARDLNSMLGGVDIFALTIPARTILAMLDETNVLGGMTLSEYWADVPAQIVRAYSSVIRTGVATGRTMGQIVADAVGVPGMDAVTNNVRTFVRTSVIQTCNSAREMLYADNADIVSGIAWLATLDNRTSTICRTLDGLQWTTPDHEPIGHDRPYPGATAHPNCRSTQVPVLRSFEALAGKNPKVARALDRAMSQGERSSLDGQVSSRLTYNDWLGKRGDTFAKKVLGARRFDMWKSGTIGLDDLLDQSNNPLTLDELTTEFGGDG